MKIKIHRNFTLYDEKSETLFLDNKIQVKFDDGDAEDEESAPKANEFYAFSFKEKEMT